MTKTADYTKMKKAELVELLHKRDEELEYTEQDVALFRRGLLDATAWIKEAMSYLPEVDENPSGLTGKLLVNQARKAHKLAVGANEAFENYEEQIREKDRQIEFLREDLNQVRERLKRAEKLVDEGKTYEVEVFEACKKVVEMLGGSFDPDERPDMQALDAVDAHLEHYASVRKDCELNHKGVTTVESVRETPRNVYKVINVYV